MYATFAEDLSGFFGKWTTTTQAPYLKRLGSPPREGSPANSPVREPKWTDETDEDDAYLFSDRDETPAKPRGRVRRRLSMEQPRRQPLERVVRLAARRVEHVARAVRGFVSSRVAFESFKMFKVVSFMLNLTLSTFEIPRQMFLIPLVVGRRLRVVPPWVFAMFEAGEQKPKEEFKFPKLRWNALKVWENVENVVRTQREKLQRTESAAAMGETEERRKLVEALIVEGRAHDKACDSEKSQLAFEKALELRPEDPVIMVSLSKELSDRVFDHEIFHNKPLARKFAKEASDLAERALKHAPQDTQAYIALAVANARLSMFSEARQKVELTHVIKDNLLKALEMDPKNDYALHVLARLEHTMSNISGFTRYLIKAIYGAIEPATIENAEKYFRQAIEINPKRLIHQVELAKLLYEVKRFDEAKELLMDSLTLEIEDINSVRTRKDGVELLSKLDNRMLRSPSRLGSMMRTPSKSALQRTPSKSALKRSGSSQLFA
jgi:tetratricopeptide (TPR) repeat protein